MKKKAKTSSNEGTEEGEGGNEQVDKAVLMPARLKWPEEQYKMTR